MNPNLCSFGLVLTQIERLAIFASKVRSPTRVSFPSITCPVRKSNVTP